MSFLRSFIFLIHGYESSMGGYKNEKFKTQGLFPLEISLSMMDLQIISHFKCQFIARLTLWLFSKIIYTVKQVQWHRLLW